MADRQAHHIQHVVLADNGDNYAPPEKPVLIVTQVGETVFLELATYDETHTTAKYELVGRVGINRETLMATLEFVNRPDAR